MTRRKVYRPRRPPRLENPDLFPAWVFCKPPDGFDAVRLRGGPVFEAMAAVGFRVQVVEPGAVRNIEIRPPWTFVYVPVPSEDWSGSASGLEDLRCSVIMDCHFPIMDVGALIGADQAIIDTIDHKDTLLANLALAEVVTVPQPGWAADLAEVNPNVHVLPDLVEDDLGGQEFIMRLGEIAQASIKVKTGRWETRKELGL